VNKVFPKDTFAADTAKFLEQFTSLSRVALLHTKKAVKEAGDAALLRGAVPHRTALPQGPDGDRGCQGRPQFLHRKAQAGLEKQIILREQT
jgi:hypothetical protein